LSREYRVVIGDSPGGLFHKTFLKNIYDICGITEAMKDLPVELNYNTDIEIVQNPSALKLKELIITKYISKADYIINLPKLKTNVPMMHSGAVKNFYGIIAGEKKFDYHFVYPETDDFADVLIDIYNYRKPDLSIMDAIIGMDHNGPTAGEPIDINLVLASEDGFALDLIAEKIIGMDPMEVPVMRAAINRKMISLEEEIEITGEKLENVKISNFTKPYIVNYPKPPKIVENLFSKFIEAIKPKVTFNLKQCKFCKECVKICPANAIQVENNKLIVKYNKCIKCFCCHELCTFNAIQIRQSMVLKTILNIALHNNSLQKSLENMFGMLGAGAQQKDSNAIPSK
jgi:uncharacterized protein (DUF362 family)/Pyruvate/2-oxoacid:ferredoxin oxidoreductase delta subunit